MTVVWKYELREERTRVEMPPGARVLTAQLQNGRVVLWSSVTWEHGTVPSERVRRTFVIRPTGHGYSTEPETYVATVQAIDGALVWHVFEVTP